MSRLIRYIILFLVLVCLQGLIFQRMVIGWGGMSYIFIFIYGQFILELPIKMSRIYIILLGFLLGLCIDVFYMSPGVHAGATVFMAFARSIVLKNIEPRSGYAINSIPSKYHFGMSWFLIYASICLFLQIFMYFVLSIFNFAEFFTIWIKSIFTFFVSFLFIIIYQFLFNPK